MTCYLRLIACVLVCTVATVASGCSSMKPIRPATQPGAPVFGQIKAGDTVSVRTQDGRSVRFIVQHVDGDALVSRDGTRYARTDIAHLQRRSFSVWKTGALAGGLAIAALLAFAIAIVSDDDFGKWS